MTNPHFLKRCSISIIYSCLCYFFYLRNATLFNIAAFLSHVLDGGIKKLEALPCTEKYQDDKIDC